ncbi:MAG: DPP IV N-terminal domain-containing protein, partial [Planctomycetota bacterium]
MKIRSKVIAIFALLFASAASHAAVELPSEADPGYLTLDRIIDSEEFDSKSFGPIRWLEDGSGYTTLEDSQANEDVNDPNDEKPRDIVRCDPESGNRVIMVPAARLIPEGESKPLKIDDYSWSSEGKKLLIFTNTKRVWRRNTRGDYWVLNLSNWKLQKLGGDAEPSTLMFAKFSPDGKRVAYVREKN